MPERGGGWETAPLVLVGDDAARRVRGAVRRRGVVLVGRDQDDSTVWRRAVEIGADHVLVLPDGLYYGRMEAHDAAGLVAAQARGEVLLDRLRGRSAYPMPLQRAEIQVRRTTGALGLDAVRLLEHHRADDVTRAVFEVAGERHEVRVRTSHDEPRRLTCAAARLNPPLRHTVLT